MHHIPLPIAIQIAHHHAAVRRTTGTFGVHKDQVARMEICSFNGLHLGPLAGGSNRNADADLSVQPGDQAAAIELLGAFGVSHIRLAHLRKRELNNSCGAGCGGRRTTLVGWIWFRSACSCCEDHINRFGRAERADEQQQDDDAGKDAVSGGLRPHTPPYTPGVGVG